MVFEWVTSKFKQRQLQKAQIQAEADHMVIVSGLSILNPTWRTFFKKYPFYDEQTDSIDLKSLESYISELIYLRSNYHNKQCEDCFTERYMEHHKERVENAIREYEQSSLMYTESLELAYLKKIVNEIIGDYSELHYSFDDNAKEFEERLHDILEEHYSFDKIISNFENKIYQKNKEIERLQLKLEESPNVEKIIVPSSEVVDARPLLSRNSSSVLKFRTKVLKRDKVCQCCGATDDLEVHHLSAFKTHNSRADEVNNGVTLCNDCHKEYHKLYGRDGYSNNPVTFAQFLREYGTAMQSNLDYVVTSEISLEGK